MNGGIFLNAGKQGTDIASFILSSAMLEHELDSSAAMTSSEIMNDDHPFLKMLFKTLTGFNSIPIGASR